VWVAGIVMRCAEIVVSASRDCKNIAPEGAKNKIKIYLLIT